MLDLWPRASHAFDHAELTIALNGKTDEKISMMTMPRVGSEKIPSAELWKIDCDRERIRVKKMMRVPGRVKGEYLSDKESHHFKT